jgi:hypothetical protein
MYATNDDIMKNAQDAASSLTSGLHEGSEVRLGDVQARQPHNQWVVVLLDPCLVLLATNNYKHDSQQGNHTDHT